MMFVEVFTPRGTLTEEQRLQISARLVTDVMDGPGAPRSVIEAGKAMCQVVMHEPEIWTVGGERLKGGSPPRYVVRASVPEAWGGQMSGHLITAFTRVLAEVEGDAERLFEHGDAWVQVIPVPEGGYGLQGRALTSNDLVRMITRSYREGADGESPEPPPGSAIDPICGMVVPLGEHMHLLEHEGTTYAFCSHGCRAVFAEDHGIAIPA